MGIKNNYNASPSNTFINGLGYGSVQRRDAASDFQCKSRDGENALTMTTGFQKYVKKSDKICLLVLTPVGAQW